MNLTIDFYSKEEVSVYFDTNGGNLFAADEANELFLYACLTLRQFSNLGQNDTARILAALLTKFGKETTHDLAEGTFVFPSATALSLLMGFSGVKLTANPETLRNYLMSVTPHVVDARSQGSKSFVITHPPLQLSAKGFGILGRDVNYYAFHSVVALHRVLAKQRLTQPAYIDHLSQVAKRCGRLYLDSGVAVGDQAALAASVLNQVGVPQQ